MSYLISGFSTRFPTRQGWGIVLGSPEDCHAQLPVGESRDIAAALVQTESGRFALGLLRLSLALIAKDFLK